MTLAVLLCGEVMLQDYSTFKSAMDLLQAVV